MTSGGGKSSGLMATSWLAFFCRGRTMPASKPGGDTRNLRAPPPFANMAGPHFLLLTNGGGRLRAEG